MSFGSAARSDLPRLVELLGMLFSQEREFSPNPDKQGEALEAILADRSRGRIFVAREGSEVLLMDRDKPMWVSTLERDHAIDFEMANHFTATHPASAFTRMLMMRAFTLDGEVRVHDRDVTLVRGGDTQTYQLADRAELRALVARYFGFDLPALASIRVPSIAEWR